MATKANPKKKEAPKKEEEKEKPQKLKKLKIYRYNSESRQHGKKPYSQEYTVDLNE